jgi:hypothetical protein
LEGDGKMKIIMTEANVFKFEIEPSDCNYICSANSYEQAKGSFLSYFEKLIDDEVQRLFIEFNKGHFSK